MAKIEILVAPASTKTKKESETPKITSSEPSSQQRMSTRKTKKEPTPDFKLEEEEVESSDKVESSNEDPESKEEAELATPLPEEKKKMETRASDRKKPASTFKTPASQKRLLKTPKKGESFQKEPRRSI